MSELHVRNAGVGGDSPGVVELEHGSVCRGSGCADGHLGEEEGVEVQEGFRRQISEEAVQYAAWDLVGMGLGVPDPGRARWHKECGATNATWKHGLPYQYHEAGPMTTVACDNVATVSEAVLRANTTYVRLLNLGKILERSEYLDAPSASDYYSLCIIF